MMLSAARAKRGGFLAACDAGGPDQLGGVDFGQAHDRDALGIRCRCVHRVIEDASGGLRAVSGGWIEGLVFAARGDLAEDGGG
jgi:hypothetical protein